MQHPQNLVTLKGVEGALTCKGTSGERGTPVTTCLIINVIGQADDSLAWLVITLAVVFPQKPPQI